MFPAANRSTWLFACIVQVIGNGVYAIALGMLEKQLPRPLPLPDPVFPWVAIVGGTLAVVSALAWIRKPVAAARSSHAPLMEPRVFLQRSLATLGDAGLISVAGLLHGLATRPAVPAFAPYGIACALVVSLVCIPAGLAYWSAWDEQRSQAAAPAN